MSRSPCNSSASSAVKINNSILSGATNSISNAGLIGLAYTQLTGGGVSNSGSGTLTCVGAYNASYVAMSTSCQ